MNISSYTKLSLSIFPEMGNAEKNIAYNIMNRSQSQV